MEKLSLGRWFVVTRLVEYLSVGQLSRVGGSGVGGLSGVNSFVIRRY